jgi:hypothetical protein
MKEVLLELTKRFSRLPAAYAPASLPLRAAAEACREARHVAQLPEAQWLVIAITHIDCRWM